MTEQQAEQQWVAQASLEHWNWEVREGERCVVFWVSESDAKRIAADHNALQVAIEALEKQGVCHRCRGTGKPQCVSCDNYQHCICRPNQGINLPHCWHCEGRRYERWAYAALEAIKEQGR